MIQLPNGCRCSGKTGDSSKGIPDELPVTPKNWKSTRASLKGTWTIHYRFYDPLFKEKYPKGKQVKAKGGVNTYHTVKERQDAIRELMDEVLNLLKACQYNPITETMAEPVKEDQDPDYIIHPDTGLVDALYAATARLKLAPSTISDINVTLTAISTAAKQRRLDTKPVKEISQRHILMIMDQCEANNAKWSDYRFNKHRANLMIVYKELKKVEAVSGNPLKEIDKAVGDIRAPRLTLTAEERRKIDKDLRLNHYRFWLFAQVFFHSGCRETELMKVQGKDVDLIGQTFWVTVKKGKVYRKEQRVIKDVALDYWRQAMEGCKPNDYVFSKGLKPGPVAISAWQISTRWRKHVKNKFGIEADFYSLKHTNYDETTAMEGMATAAEHAGHTSEAMGRVYAVGEEARKMERRKKVNNTFAPTDN